VLLTYCKKRYSSQVLKMYNEVNVWIVVSKSSLCIVFNNSELR